MKKILVLVASSSDCCRLGRVCGLNSAGMKRLVLWSGGRRGSLAVGCLEKELIFLVLIPVFFPPSVGLIALAA